MELDISVQEKLTEIDKINNDVELKHSLKHNILIDKLRSTHQSELEMVKVKAKIKEDELLAQIEKLTITNQTLLARLDNTKITPGGSKKQKKCK